jgi:hypothetical protein
MIQSDREYAIASTKLDTLKEAYAFFMPPEKDWLSEAQKRAMESIITDLEGELAEYRNRSHE